MIIRTYRCDQCGEVWEITCESNDPDPDCKYCRDVVLQWVPTRIAIGGSHMSKAVDLTQNILEKDYGLTNWNDSMREGDIAHKADIRPRAEREVMEKLEHDAKEYAKGAALSPAAQGFWAGGQSGPPQNVVAAAMAGAKEQSALAKREGVDPMQLLSKAGREGNLRIPFNPIARG